MFSFGFAGSSMNSEEEVVLINGNQTTPQIEQAGFIETPEFLTAEEEAVRCRIYNNNGNLVGSCWFCNCANFAAQF